MAKEQNKGPDPPGGPEPQGIDESPFRPGLPEVEEGKKSAGRQRGTDDSFTGRDAQLAVMAELLRRRCNAAIPEVDLGTDVFAFKDNREEVVRLQVKACTVPYYYADGSGYSAKFALPMKQFHRLDDRPPLFYALAVLHNNKWLDFLVVGRARLQTYFNGTNRFGSVNRANNDLEVTVEFRGQVTCSGQDLTDCRNAWESLPPLQPAPDLGQPAQSEAGLGAPTNAAIPPSEHGQA